METQTVLAGVGVSIAAHRRARGITQADLAARIGRSVRWVSAVEQGWRFADRLTDLVAIAAVVGVGLEDLLGRPVDSLAPGVVPRSVDVDALRVVLLRSAVPTPTEDTPDPTDVTHRVAQAWATWHGSPTAHTTLGGVLPGLLTDALACHQQTRDKTSAMALAGAWQITRQWLHHLREPDLAWIAADRAMAAAREADDPHLIALGAWALSASFRRVGQQQEATRLCLAAGDELAPLLEASSPDPALLAAYGMLHLAAAVSAALGDADAVVDNAARLDLEDMPSVHRRACALIDTARGFVRRGEDEAAVLVLLDAEQASVDEVRHSILAREMVRELLHRDRARARAHVRGLAQRIGLIAS